MTKIQPSSFLISPTKTKHHHNIIIPFQHHHNNFLTSNSSVSKNRSSGGGRRKTRKKNKMFKWLNLPLQIVVEYITDMEKKIRDDTPYLVDHLCDHHQRMNPHTTCCYPIFDPCFNNFSKNKKIKNKSKNKSKGLHVATT